MKKKKKENNNNNNSNNKDKKQEEGKKKRNWPKIKIEKRLDMPVLNKWTNTLFQYKQINW